MKSSSKVFQKKKKPGKAYSASLGFMCLNSHLCAWRRKERVNHLTPKPHPHSRSFWTCSINLCIWGPFFTFVFWISGALEVWRALCLYFGSVQGPTLLQNPHSASNDSLCFLREAEEDLAQRDREGWAEGGRGRGGERPNQKYHFRITSITCPDSDHAHYTDSKESARSHTA